MQIGVVGLGWYISIMLALLTMGTTAITYAPPGPGPLERALPIVFGAGTITFVGLTLSLNRLPSTHWLRQSRSARAGFAAVAVTVTVLVVLFG